MRFILVTYPEQLKSAEIIQSQLQSPCPLKSIPNLRMATWQLEGIKIATLNAITHQQIKAFRSNLAQFDTRMFEAESLLYDSANHSVYQTSEESPLKEF